MHWTDQAILLSVRKHGETSAVVRVFSHEHGVYAGVVRGASSKQKRGILQPGNIVSAIWNARLSEQLGTIACELLAAHAAHIMNDAVKLAALSSACALLESALPERHPYSKLYTKFEEFLNCLNPESRIPAAYLEAYILLELDILAETGFGLDLSCCAGTGATEDLIYVSPKSGRAVSREAGEPYRDKLLVLPSFLCHPRLARGSRVTCDDSASGSRSPRKAGMTAKEILAGLTLTGFFLEHWLLEPHKRKLPAARKRLSELV